MIYATLTQAPANTFAGGISMGFCPDLKTSKPFCRGSGTLASKPDPKLGYIYQAVPTLPASWAVLQGNIDQVCSTPETKAFTSGVKGASYIGLPRVGHGFSVQGNWMPQFRNAFHAIVDSAQAKVVSTPAGEDVRHLPLVELPIAHNNHNMAVIVSGDGGWASIDKQIGEALNKSGLPVVGINSLQYFWEKKNPDVAGRDLTRILSHYRQAWGVDHFILVGYSRGADTLPFMISRLPDALKASLQSVLLLGLEDTIDFEFHVEEWLSSSGSGSYKVIPELQKLKGLKVTCIYGSDEIDSACKKLGGSVRVIEMKGGHHFGGNYEKLAAIILDHGQ